MTNQHETLQLLLGIQQKPAQTAQCGLKIFQSVKILGLEIPDHPNKKNNIILRPPFSGHCPGDKKASTARIVKLLAPGEPPWWYNLGVCINSHWEMKRSLSNIYHRSSLPSIHNNHPYTLCILSFQHPTTFLLLSLKVDDTKCCQCHYCLMRHILCESWRGERSASRLHPWAVLLRLRTGRRGGCDACTALAGLAWTLGQDPLVSAPRGQILVSTTWLWVIISSVKSFATHKLDN